MIITVSIMAHPKRRAQARALLDQLLPYPFYTTSIIWDEQNSEWHTGKRALEAGLAGEGGDWHVVLQDDAIIPEGFYDHLVSVLQAAPQHSLISLYVGKVRPFRDRVQKAVRTAKNGSFLSGYTLFWAVGIVLPTKHIEPMLEFVEDRTDPFDTRIGHFYFANRIPVLYTNPALVDHDDSLGSLLGNDHEPAARVAHNFITGPVKWTGRITEI